LTLRHLDLFSGIGGFSLGLESAELVETVAFCDFDKYCKKILNKNWPQVPVYDNVKELNYDRLKSDGIISGEKGIDIITGGYPCQPFSVAGKQKGEQDPRHVWPEMFRLVQELRPSWVIGENVGGHIKLGLDTVLENLASEGYSTRTFSISASSIGANHQRERVWIIAHSNERGRNDRFNHWEERQVPHDQERDSQKGQSERGGRVNRIGETSPIMEDTRRSLRSRAFEQRENDNEVGKGNADQHQRSSGTSQSNVADSDKSNSRKRSYDGNFGNERGQTSSTERKSLQSENRQTCSNNPRSSSKIVADSDTRLSNGENEEIRSRGETSDTSSARRGDKKMADSESISSNERELGNSQEENRQERKVKGQTRGGDGDRNVSNREMADSDSERLQRQWQSRNKFRPQFTTTESSEEGQGTMDQGWWEFEPNVGRVAHGIPNRVDRLKCLGNSVVPQIPYLLGVSIRKTIENE
jgi:DNA (cytosine-5)-methyltransferase 1